MPLILNIEQENCKYQFLNLLFMTRWGNWTQNSCKSCQLLWLNQLQNIRISYSRSGRISSLTRRPIYHAMA